jgi:hypothetical protein
MELVHSAEKPLETLPIWEEAPSRLEEASLQEKPGFRPGCSDGPTFCTRAQSLFANFAVKTLCDFATEIAMLLFNKKTFLPTFQVLQPTEGSEVSNQAPP